MYFYCTKICVCNHDEELEVTNALISNFRITRRYLNENFENEILCWERSALRTHSANKAVK